MSGTNATFVAAAEVQDDDEDHANAGLFASYFASRRALVSRHEHALYKGRAFHFLQRCKIPGHEFLLYCLFLFISLRVIWVAGFVPKFHFVFSCHTQPSLEA